MSSEEMSSEEMSSEEMDDDSMTEEESSMDEEMAEAEDSSEEMMLPSWQQLSVTNARTGASFSLADFHGKTVFVEPMATWCGNCRRQLSNVREAQQQLNSDDVVFVALSVETNLSDSDLANYAENEGFDWVFAVSSADLVRELVGEFGQSITNPPSTPHFIIRPDGSTTDLVTGIEPAADIAAQITAAQG